MSADAVHEAQPTVLITGAGGFVGRYLTRALQRRHPGWRLDTPSGDQGQTILDVTDTAAVNTWIASSRPDIVVHLAAVAAVTESVKDPRRAWSVNLDGTLNLVLAMQAFVPKAHLLFVSSAEVYGESLNAPGAIDESALLQPVNPYAASKAAADILVRQAAAAGLSACVMRPFNHTGVGQGEAFAIPNFAAQIARIEAGLQPPVINVGSLDDERDFLDVRDVVDAYVLALERRDQARGVFNVASGAAVSIRSLLDHLLALATTTIEVRVDPARLRGASIRRVVGDASRLKDMGWSPSIVLHQTLGAILEDQRQALRER